MMEHWKADLDRWLTTPPEEPESKFLCAKCKEPFYPDDKYFDCDGEKYCEECAMEWFKSQALTATEEDCYEF